MSWGDLSGGCIKRDARSGPGRASRLLRFARPTSERQRMNCAMPITLLDIILHRRHADLGAARDDPRLHARDAVDRLLGDRRGGDALLVPEAAAVREAIFQQRHRGAAVVIGGVFLGTLLIVSIITVRISDMVLDSRVGALDRTLGFLFGLGRGLIIVVVAFLFFAWLVPPRSQPEWVQQRQVAGRAPRHRRWLMRCCRTTPKTILKRLKQARRPTSRSDEPADSDPPRLDAVHRTVRRSRS